MLFTETTAAAAMVSRAGIAAAMLLTALSVAGVGRLECASKIRVILRVMLYGSRGLACVIMAVASVEA